MKHTHTLLPLSITLAALLLLSSCTAPARDTINTTTVTTTATITTTAPENTYRPDLFWASNAIIDASLKPVNLVAMPNVYASEKPVPCIVWVFILAEDQWTIAESFIPTDYFSSLGWEILPDSALDHIELFYPRGGEVIVAVPDGKALFDFDINDLMEYYNLDPALLDNDQILVQITQCIIKKDVQ